MKRSLVCLLLLAHATGITAPAAENVVITDMPDYDWYAGCWGTAAGNLMGYWDRHGFPDFYTGPTNDGLAPLNSAGSNKGIRSMWASKAGFDGRPADQPGHTDDYWTYLYYDAGGNAIYSYESTDPDPYLLGGRAEHSPDCICDFMGASQRKWSDLDGECSGNIDAYAFNFWEHQGNRRVNFTPPALNSLPVRDVQSGLRQWTQSRGYDAEVASQLVDFNPTIPSGAGFTFADLKAEIDAGYPVGLMLQNPGELSRTIKGVANVNPDIHAMVAYGYLINDDGRQFVRYRTSWASGDNMFTMWGPGIWQAEMTLRGVITFRPIPKITKSEVANGTLKISWDGPSTILQDNVSGNSFPAHWYRVEKSDEITGEFTAISDPISDREIVVSSLPTSGNAFFRVKVLTPEEAGKPRGQ